MTSARQFQANRLNARASTGPRTARGKAKAARNSRRHRLSLPVLHDPASSDQVKSLAQKIAGEDSSEEFFRLACRIAEAQVDLNRTRQARDDLLAGNMNDPAFGQFQAATINMRRVTKIGRRFGMLKPIPYEFRHLFLPMRPQGVQKFATILKSLSKQLSLIDRYERRALSRRKFAVRAFDLARSRGGAVH